MPEILDIKSLYDRLHNVSKKVLDEMIRKYKDDGVYSFSPGDIEVEGATGDRIRSILQELQDRGFISRRSGGVYRLSRSRADSLVAMDMI